MEWQQLSKISDRGSFARRCWGLKLEPSTCNDLPLAYRSLWSCIECTHKKKNFGHALSAHIERTQRPMAWQPAHKIIWECKGHLPGSPLCKTLLKETVHEVTMMNTIRAAFQSEKHYHINCHGHSHVNSHPVSHFHHFHIYWFPCLSTPREPKIACTSQTIWGTSNKTHEEHQPQ